MAFNERDDIRERYGKPQRPAIQFTRRDDVRDFMKSPQGKNYGNMMDLQNQAIRQGGFDKGDSRIDELKKARRQYNRKDKYGIASLMGYSPQDANEIYRQNSGVLREHARPTYKTMYPISDMAHEVTGSGGLTGTLLNQAFGKSKKAGKGFFKDLRQMGADIFGGIGIGGAVPREEATEEILENYSDQTFGPINIHAGEDITVAPWLLDPTLPMPEELTEGEYLPGQYHDKLIEGPLPPMPFDDSNREEGIRRNMMPGKGRSDKDHPLWDEYWNFLIDEGDSYDNVQGGPPSFEEYKGAWERIHALPRGLHYMEPRAGRR